MKTDNKYIYPIIDIMLDAAVKEVEAAGDKISCGKGCDHCCHLLIEITWEEALELANWVLNQAKTCRDELIEKIKANAAEARVVFRGNKKGERFCKPIESDIEISDNLFDNYFYEKKRPCPFLEHGACRVYAVRPSPCRLHLVTSNPDKCSFDYKGDDEVDTPEEVETVSEEIGPIVTALSPDPRWGQMGIMVEAALLELQQA